MLNYSSVPDTTTPPTWTTWREALRVVGYPPFLRKTLGIAAGVGTLLFLINHADALVNGTAGARTCVKGLMTCLVPFCVANWGVLVGSRRR